MESSKILLEAIARKTSVEATYNRTRVELAPHILYTRHGELYVDAVTVGRDGRPPREVKLGTFKLSGLGAVAIAGRPFERDSVFDVGQPKYEGTTLFAVE
ncbi:hypothetical protein ACFB49_15630 [Sphingomonas sp. DBB INV C78]|uniref:hypothetical protein n=1 Tax=Sphingomonas sp. DBB INV C78 TaxID=3349434 RepID=UPI0036D25566